MATKSSLSGGMVNHPSYQSSLTVLECDRCGREFRADCCVSDRYEFHGERVGLRDYSGGEPEDLCLECEAEVFGED